jgi:nucleoside-diphosphate-sugar epimerase
MKRALVTGGQGFVGRNFSRRLRHDGWAVTIVDDLLAHSDFLIHEAFYAQDIREWVRSYAPDHYDLIIHCAAVVGGRLKIDGDPLAVATDLAIDSDFFNWVVKAKNRPKVVYFSSSAVYPIDLQVFRVTLAESFVSQGSSRFGRPDMSYGWSKLTGEYLAHLAVQQYGADVAIYRPFSGYGEDQSFDYPFPSIIRRIVNRENPITIWGSGDQCRDFIHIDDVVEAVMQTKDVLAPGDVLNLGSGIPISFRQLVAMAHTECGLDTNTYPCDIECDTTKPEGVFYRVADTYKLHQFYKPKVSLEEGIRRVAAHLKERANA